MSFPPAAITELRNLSLTIAGLEQLTSEVSTQHAHHANLSTHPATRRFLEELEFLHASHARVLRQYAAELVDEQTLTSTPPLRKNVSALAAAPMNDPEEILTFTYTQLNLLAANYTRLHTLAVAFGHDATAGLSLNHLKSITPKIMECSQAIPLLTADIASQRFGHISPGCAQKALETTQGAWKNDTQFSETT